MKNCRAATNGKIMHKGYDKVKSALDNGADTYAKITAMAAVSTHTVSTVLSGSIELNRQYRANKAQSRAESLKQVWKEVSKLRKRGMKVYQALHWSGISWNRYTQAIEMYGRIE